MHTLYGAKSELLLDTANLRLE